MVLIVENVDPYLLKKAAKTHQGRASVWKLLLHDLLKCIACKQSLCQIRLCWINSTPPRSIAYVLT